MTGWWRTEIIHFFIHSFRNISQAPRRWQELCQTLWGAQRWMRHVAGSHLTRANDTHGWLFPYGHWVIVRNLMPAFPAFIPSLCSGRRGMAATEGSVFGQRTTHWNTDQGKPEETVLSSAVWLGTALATSVSLEKKINYVNNWTVSQWERFHTRVNTFYSRCFESSSWRENVDVAAMWGLVGHP